MTGIIRIIGEVLIASGILLLIYTLVRARKDETFTKRRELRQIRQAGYTKEHKEAAASNPYSKASATDHSRLMSRRAQRVLEKMEEDPKMQEEGRRKGTSHLEEVERPDEKKPSHAAEEKTALLTEEPPAEQETALLDEDRTEKLEEDDYLLIDDDAAFHNAGTELLDMAQTGEEKTALLEDEQKTDLLQEQGADPKAEDATELLDQEDTVLLDQEESTALLNAEESTVPLGQNQDTYDAASSDSQKTELLEEEV